MNFYIHGPVVHPEKPIEMERKFKIKNDDWRKLLVNPNQIPKKIHQAYIFKDKKSCVRVRTCGKSAWLAIKRNVNDITREEYEYPIPFDDAVKLMSDIPANKIVMKDRYVVYYHNKLWEIDIFYNNNFGLQIAEIELTSEDEEFDIPDWVGEEVTNDPRYLNVCLSDYPYESWRPMYD